METKDGIRISYTKHHLEQHKDAEDSTTNGLLPLIKYNLNDFKFQAHIIEVCNSVHQVLTQRARNLGTAIACSDQPLYAWSYSLKFSKISHISQLCEIYI